MGYTVTPLHPSFIFSTDDTSLYITDDEIKYESPNKLHLLSNDGNEIKSYRNAKSISKKDGTHGGFRVKLCFTITAAGQMADICIIVSGLDENKLPMSEADLSNSKGIRVIEIKGLTPGCTMNP